MLLPTMGMRGPARLPERNACRKHRSTVRSAKGTDAATTSPVLFGEDEEGYGKVLGDCVVPPEKHEDARRAANCAEEAVSLTERA
jgi:ferredoxin